jgi:intracellular septation protein
MKLLFDLFPVILFFATFKYSEKNPELASSWMGSLLGFVPDDIKLAPILLATVVVIAATVAQIIWVHFVTARSTRCSGSAWCWSSSLVA